MATLDFTPQLRRFVDAPSLQAEVLSLAELLALAFAQRPRLRDYVLDEQGQLRPHVAVFVDGRRCLRLDTPLRPDSRVHVMQALSGG